MVTIGILSYTFKFLSKGAFFGTLGSLVLYDSNGYLLVQIGEEEKIQIVTFGYYFLVQLTKFATNWYSWYKVIIFCKYYHIWEKKQVILNRI